MIGQIRYYGEGSDMNSGGGVEAATSAYNKLIQGNNTFQKINASQIVIQSFPGLRFRVNSQPQNPEWSQLGPTGIFELKLNNLMKINSLEIHEDDLKKINDLMTQGGEPCGYIIVDYVYEGE